MTELAWTTVRQLAIDKFGEAPGPQLEEEIIRAFEQAPHAVVETIHEVAALVQTGEIRSGWALTRTRTRRIIEPAGNVVVHLRPQRRRTPEDDEAAAAADLALALALDEDTETYMAEWVTSHRCQHCSKTMPFTHRPCPHCGKSLVAQPEQQQQQEFVDA